MIEAKLFEVRDALRAFTGTPGVEGSGIGNAKLPAKAAHRVGRLVGKLRDEVGHAEETMRTLFRNAGAALKDGQLVLELGPQRDDEPDGEYEARGEAHRVKVENLNKEIEALMADAVKIDYDPIPIEMFGDAELMPVDCGLAGPFLKE